MAVLVLKLVLCPTLVGAASLVQRRWGHALGGRLVGLPLTTGPFLAFLGVQYGAGVAARGAAGVIAGQMAVVTFTRAYAGLAGRHTWGISLGGAAVTSVVSTAIVAALPIPLWTLVLVVAASLAYALATCPAGESAAGPLRVVPARWELPLRIVLVATLVVTLTGSALVLGERLAGILATLPVIASVLAPTTHRSMGAAAAQGLVRGVLASMWASVAFAATVAYTVRPLGLELSLCLAVVAAIVVQAAAEGIAGAGAGVQLSTVEGGGALSAKSAPPRERG
jgi:hypothetical protein